MLPLQRLVAVQRGERSCFSSFSGCRAATGLICGAADSHRAPLHACGLCLALCCPLLVPATPIVPFSTPITGNIPVVVLLSSSSASPPFSASAASQELAIGSLKSYCDALFNGIGWGRPTFTVLSLSYKQAPLASQPADRNPSTRSWNAARNIRISGLEGLEEPRRPASEAH